MFYFYLFRVLFKICLNFLKFFFLFLFFLVFHEGLSARARVDPDLCKKALGSLEAAAEHREEHDRAAICRDWKGDLRQTEKTRRGNQIRDI